MAKRKSVSKVSAKNTATGSVSDEKVAPLRLVDRTRTDWAFNAEGWLIVYDPSVVNDRVFEKLKGLQTIAAAALGWMNGGGNSMPFINQPEHWCGERRDQMAERIAELVRLGWNGSLALLPLVIASNGADIHLRSSPLTAEENSDCKNAFRAKHHQHKLKPCRGWIVAQKNRLAVTWDFVLGFTPAQRKKTFDAGSMVEFDWPAGSYKITGRTLPESEDPKTGLMVSNYVLQLETADF